MKKLLSFFVIVSSLLIIQCSNEIPTSNEPVDLDLGKILLRIDKANAPVEVVLVEAFLSRDGHDTLYGALNIITSTSADILFDDINAGEWHLKVNAKDSLGIVIYTGETSLEVFAGILTQVNLTLVPTGNGTGSIYILVNWGTSSGSAWEQMDFPVQSDLHCVHIVDSLIVYAAGDDGIIYKTADGGQTWINRSPQSSTDWYSIFFTNSELGWVGGRQGQIARTTDGGLTWNINSVSVSHISNVVESMYFADENTGYIAGGGLYNDRETYIYKTTNGGQTWDEQLFLYGGVLLEMSFVDQNTGYIVGTNGAVLKTTNGGSFWQYCFVNTGYWLRSVYFLNSQEGVVMGQAGHAWKTSDGANSWNQLNTNSNDFIESVCFYNNNTGWAVGGGGLGIFTTDAGNTWINSPFPTSNYLSGVRFYQNKLGIVVGDNGTVFRLKHYD